MTQKGNIEHVQLIDEAATQEYAVKLASFINFEQHNAFYFEGEIGAGKTTLIRALFRHLGVQGAIKSPTFSILETYHVNELNPFPIHHFDLYRLAEPQELEFLGWRECFAGPSLCCIEWPERAKNYLPEPSVLITLTVSGSGRVLSLTKNRMNSMERGRISPLFSSNS